MRRISHRGLVAAMEEENLLPEEAATDEVSDLANSQEEGLTDIAEDEAGLAEHDALTDEAVDTAEALESIRDDLKAALEHGGLEQGGAAILRSSLGHLYKRTGLKTVRVTPALESFGSISRREDATKIALEEVKEQLKKIWETIVAAVKKAIEWIKSFWKKLWDNTEPMIKRAEELKAAASKVEGEASEKVIKNAGMAKALHIQGKVPEGAEGAARMVEVGKKVFGDYGAWINSIEGSTKDLSNISEFTSAMDHDSFGLDPIHDAASQGIPAEGEAKVGRSKELPGGNALVVIIAKDIEKSKAGVMPFNKTSAEFKGEDVPVHQNKEHMIAVCDAVIEIGNLIKTNENTIGICEKAKNDLLKKMDEAQKKEEGQGEAIKAARAALKLIDTPYVALASYAVKVGKSLNQQVEQSIKAFGAKKEEAKPEAKPEAKAA
jgi:TfoX/Sxy family transcriptional regulator of competence genes